MPSKFEPKKVKTLAIYQRLRLLTSQIFAGTDDEIEAAVNTTRKALVVDLGGHFLDTKQGAMPYDRWGLLERFDKLPQLSAVTQAPTGDTFNTAAFLAEQRASQNFEVLGTNAVSASVTRNAEGGITLTTAGASGDSVIILPHLTADQSPWTGVTWGTDKELIFEAVIKTKASVASMAFWVGLKLTNTPVVATDNDQVMVHFDTGSLVSATKLRTVSSIGGTDTDGATGPTVAAATVYKIKIVIAADRTARIYVNGALLATTGALTDATDLIPYIGVKALTAAAKSIDVYQEALSRIAG